METPQAPCEPRRFGDFELSEDTGELRRRGVRVRLSGQAFDVLVLLVSARGRIVTREELQQRLWPTSSFGDFDHGLNAAVNRLREALNDSAANPTYVETVPRRGYRFIFPLESSTPIPKPPADEVSAPPSSPSHRLAFLTLAALLLITGVFLGVHFYRRGHTPPPPDDLAEAPFTTLSGSEIGPTFSPDGSQVAFEWDGENNGAGFDLYVQAVGAGSPRRLTQQPTRAWVSTAWSPDGRTIATRSTELENASLNLIPSTGGPPRRIAALYGEVYTGMRLLSWSPDSKILAFIDHAASAAPELKRSDLFFLSLDTLERHRVETHCISTVLPAFSYDGKSLAFACVLGYDHYAIDILNLADGTARRIFDSSGEISGLDWGPGRFLYFARSSTGGSKTLWRIDPSNPTDRVRIPAGAHISDFAINHATGRLVYAQYTQVANLWRLPLNPTGRAEPFIPSTRTQNNPNISRDGKRVAFESDRSGSREVWIANSEGRDLQQITSFSSLTGTPRWSPDSTRLLLDSRASGQANLYVYDTSNGSLRKVNTSTEANSLASWSPEGKSILYTVGREGEQPAIWQVYAEGGQARKLIDNAELPIVSPDDQWIYFRRSQPGNVNLMRAHPDGSAAELIQSWHVDNMSVAWWPSGSGFYIIRPRNNAEQIDFLDPVAHRTTPIYTTAHNSIDWVGGLAVSPGARWLLFNQIEQTSADLFLVNGLKPGP